MGNVQKKPSLYIVIVTVCHRQKSSNLKSSALQSSGLGILIKIVRVYTQVTVDTMRFTALISCWILSTDRGTFDKRDVSGIGSTPIFK
jgi:hypothetical protein